MDLFRTTRACYGAPPTLRQQAQRHPARGLLVRRHPCRRSTPLARDHRGKAKLNFRLIGDSDTALWDLPSKPKWMRWSTYSRLEERFERYEQMLDNHLIGLMDLLEALEGKPG